MADEDNQYAPIYEVSTPFIALLIVYGTVLLATIIMVLRRCHLQPLRFRDPYLLIGTVVSQYVNSVVSSSFVAGSVTNCFLQEVIEVPYLSLLVLIMARFWKLLLASHLTQARLADKNDSWILRHPWMASSSIIWRGSLALIIALTFFQYSIAIFSHGCVWSRNIYYFNAVLLMAFWFSIALMTWKLREIQDGFFVVSELKMLGVTVLVANLFLIIYCGNASFDKTAQTFVLITFMIQLLIQTWYPLWKSYSMAVREPQLADTITRIPDTPKSQESTGEEEEIRDLTPESPFNDILRHPDGFDAMKRFLTLEFSVENLLCWHQLHTERHERDPDKVLRHFRSIYENFIRDGSPNEVNIHSDLKNCFRDVMVGRHIDLNLMISIRPTTISPNMVAPDADTDIKTHLLRQLYIEIVKLMQFDSYSRFKQTKEFQYLIRTQAENHAVAMRA